MLRISVHKLLQYSTEQLWDMLTGEFVLCFDDGEIVTNWKSTIYSSYFWEYHRLYPGNPVLVSHHLDSVLKGKRVSSGTHLSLVGAVCWSVYDGVKLTMPESEWIKLRYHFAYLSYRFINQMYNDLSYRLEEYVESIDPLDFIDIFDQPEIQEGYANLKPTEKSIIGMYSIISKTVSDPRMVASNSLSRLFASKLVKENQVHQCLGPLGFRTDIDSFQYKIPVFRSYLEGLKLPYDSITESRSAAKALVFSKEPLQEAEYFSRKLQHLCMNVERIHIGDCGTKKFIKWRVNGPSILSNGSSYKGHLQHLVGMRYLDEKTGELLSIKATDQHLIGKTINLRSVIHCMHPDPNGFCSTCYGDLYESVPPDSNIGHMCSTYMTEQSSQSVLSTKHLDGSATLDSIDNLTARHQQFITIGNSKTSYVLSDDIKGKKVSLLILPKYVKNLTDVLEIDDVRSLVLGRISAIPDIWIEVNDGKSIVTENIPTRLDSKRIASMTHDLLKHCKENGWEVITGTDNNVSSIKINLDDWDWDKPILELPPKHFNMSDHSKGISSIIESSVDEIGYRDNINPEVLLMEFFEHVNQKLSVNLAILQVIFYSAMIISAEDRDYGLPKPWTNAGVGVSRVTMAYRSIASHMAYERHHEIISDPTSYTYTNRVDHPFDSILMPREVLG